MKIYPKRYENLFNKPDNRKGKLGCYIEKVAGPPCWTPTEYRKMVEKHFKRMEKRIFDDLVRAVWLFKQFRYYGRQRALNGPNGFFIDAAFGIFMRKYCNYDARMVSYNRLFLRIASYFNDFFPDFLKNNPFEEPEKYKFPYKYMGLSHLAVVRWMDERMEILQYAENKKMKYVVFLDWVLNWIGCYNEEHPQDKYLFRLQPSHMPFIQKIKDYEKFQKNKYQPNKERAKERKISSKADNIN